VTLTLTTRHQLLGLGAAALMMGWLGVSTVAMVAGQDDELAARQQQQLASLERELAAVRSEARLIKGDVSQRADLLQARQEFLTALIAGTGDAETLAAMLPRKLDDEAEGVEAMMPPLMAVEQQQLALVDKAVGATEARLRGTQAMIRKLGLDPKRFSAASDWRRASAIGGPFVPASEELEPRFADLYISWRKLEAMQESLTSIPAMVPVKNYRMSSRFGRRFDPFNGRLALHAGLDLAGSRGEPIYAAADGRIAKAGRMSGYGTMAEINHGKGLSTRYSHMSLVLVKPGQRVKQGDMIGRMGSTGRSTGTHLHYEIRVDGQAVNPKPFIDASAYLLAAQREGSGANLAPRVETASLADPQGPTEGGMLMSPIPPLG
jgi:murein DD-endopeptidase MepM/ murein hydrolase activator NlpD